MKEKQKSRKFNPWLFWLAVFVGSVVIAGIIGAMSNYYNWMSDESCFNSYIMAYECCNGTYCTDTLYDSETNTCTLTMCKGFGVWGANCTYKGAGIPLEKVKEMWRNSHSGCWL